MSITELEQLVSPFANQVGGLIQAFRAIMRRNGWIDPDFLPVIASLFNQSVAEVRGVVSFYADFKLEPPKEMRLSVCQAEACQALGARRLMKELRDAKVHERVDLEFDHVFCLGLCPMGPAADVNGKLVAEATVERIQALIK